ncbi:hypothetical protein ABZ567_04130 [Streptomyces sp. NPDC016459]|uniref:hypothetical protein n=1 Tax=Streptomyces sp. NPDC016459 TaxID=3157190 RepID=UPI0034118661
MSAGRAVAVTVPEKVLAALQERAEGLTHRELNAKFPGLGYDRMESILQGLYDDGLIGLDVVTDRRVARWVTYPNTAAQEGPNHG